MSFFRTRSTYTALTVVSTALAIIFLFPAQTSAAQAAFQAGASESNSRNILTEMASSKDELPDAPEPQGDGNSGIKRATTSRTPRFAPAPRAPLYNKYIEPSQSAQPLIGFERKLNFGLHQIASPYFVLAVVSSAGYEHVIDSSPNYGTDKGAFGQRIGAAAIRNASDSMFSDGLMPALFHQDSRYYVMGKRRGVLPRGVYAASRVFVTRSDSGAIQPNFALFSGHAATAALENAYYPADNRGARETAESYAESFAGTALSNAIREFLPDLLHLAHLE